MAKRSIPEVNAGSMADIAFLLLIFFLVTTTIESNTGITVKLPPKPQENTPPPPPVKEKNVLVVVVNKNNQLLINNQFEGTLKTLNKQLLISWITMVMVLALTVKVNVIHYLPITQIKLLSLCVTTAKLRTKPI